MSYDIVRMEDPFQADLNILQDPAVPAQQKQWMLNIILDDIVPYRFSYGPRLFPELEFYTTLLGNRDDFIDIWCFVERFHSWIYYVALSSPEDTDSVIENLRLLRDSCSLSGQQNAAPRSTQGPGQTSMELSAALDQACQLQTPKRKTRARNAPLTADQHPFLSAELQKPPTFTYQGIILNTDHFTELDAAYSTHVKRQPGMAPEDDPTWPHTAEKQREYVGALYNSITNMQDFYELRKARATVKERTKNGINGPEANDLNGEYLDNNGPGLAGRKRKRAGDNDEHRPRPKGISKADWTLVDVGSTPLDQLEAVIHHRISDIEIEILCWKLLVSAKNAQRGITMRPLWSGTRTVSTWNHYDTFGERWAAICAEILDCKILIHSLTRADWIAKFAGAPVKERGAKLSNDLLNGRRDVQNQVGREVIKEKTSSQDWMTSEDFKIRTRDGELVIRGAQLGDKTRRQLAIRPEAQGA
ncbi:hypothetical protein EsH8_VIII_000215 [Colletotrichum jinshuiense]